VTRPPAAQPTPSVAVARGALALLSTQPLTWTASLLAAILVPRYLGAQALGEYATAVAAAGLLGSIVTAGVPNALVRQVARAPVAAPELASSALGLLVLLAALGGVVVLAGVALLEVKLVPVDLLSLALLGLVVLAAQDVLFAVLNGQGRHARFAWLNAISVMAATGAGLAVLIGGFSVVEFMAASLLGSAAVIMLGWGLSRLVVVMTLSSVRPWAHLLREGLPFLAMNLTLRVRGEADRLILVALSSAHAVGWYAAASRISAIPIFIPTLVTTPLVTALSRLQHDRAAFREILERSVVVVLSLTVPISALQIAIAPVLPRLLDWGPAFEQSVPLIVILALQQPIVALDIVLATALVALDREHHWLRYFAAVTALGCVANFLLIPWFDRVTGNGAIGASLSSLGIEAILLGGALALLRDAALGRVVLRVAGQVYAAGAALLIAVTALWQLSPLVALPVGGLAFVLSAILLGILRWTDLRVVPQAVAVVLSRR
jgi:O-antigen/teichoic acid export membrane protein